MLRHTICSHLAMRGAWGTRFRNLSPAAADAAIRLLEPAPVLAGIGDSLETRAAGAGNGL
jgi:hypothetical protein